MAFKLSVAKGSVAPKGSGNRGTPGVQAPVFDFRKSDRISKAQLRAINLLHENFVRTLVSSLSAYLRTYVVVDLVSVEQVSYAEFLELLPSPTCLASLALTPYDGTAVLVIDQALAFPIIEILLGGSGKAQSNPERELTEIEQHLIDGIHRIVLNDLKEAWATVTHIDFAILSKETEPQFLQVMAPNEAVVAISIPVRIGENEGTMNIAMPSLMIKTIRQKFDQQWSMRKTESTTEGQWRMFQLLQNSRIEVDVRLNGPTLAGRDVLKIKKGDILRFEYAVDRPLECLFNGRLQYRAQVASAGKKRAFVMLAETGAELIPRSTTHDLDQNVSG